MDIEDHELLETGPPPIGIAPDRVPFLPLEDLLLEHGEDNPRLGPSGLSFLDMPDFPQLGSALARIAVSTVRDLPLDTDSEDENCLIEVDDQSLALGANIDEIRVDLDGSDEDELSTMSAAWPPTDYSTPPHGQHLLAPLVLHRDSRELMGIISSPRTRATAGFYVDSALRSKPPALSRRTLVPYRGNTLNRVVASHATRQAGSGDIGTSQAKDEMNHMSHPEEWRSQVARSRPPAVITMASRASMHLDLEFPAKFPDIVDKNSFDMDKEDDIGFLRMQIPEIDEFKSFSPNTDHPDLLNHTYHHEDFLDVLSEEFSDEELDIDGLVNRNKESTFNSTDCIIDEDMITDLVTQRTGKSHPTSSGLPLEDEILALEESGSDYIFSQFVGQTIAESFWKDGDVIHDCLHNEAFTELIM